MLTRALRYPSCSIDVLEAFRLLVKRNKESFPETDLQDDGTPLEATPEKEEKDAKRRLFDLPRRLFRNLDKRPKWTDNDAPLPYLRHLFDTFKDDDDVGLRPDANANQGYALTKAVHIRFIPLVRFLLEHGASPEPKDCLAIIVAIRQKNLALVKMLIERQESPSGPSSSKKRRRLEDRVKPDVKMLKEAVRCKARDITEYLYHEKGVVPDMTTLQMMM
ncbi:hypothetical protein H1R20_g15770, partial [Candolleomyces eurysporus]